MWPSWLSSRWLRGYSDGYANRFERRSHGHGGMNSDQPSRKPVDKHKLKAKRKEAKAMRRLNRRQS